MPRSPFHLLSSVVALILSSAAVAAPPTTRINWSPCYKDVGSEFGVAYECANINVPLDYARQQGAAVQLALVRLPATDSEDKIGSILLNPGGPGGSGVDFALGFGPSVGLIWGPEVRARFDIVGFDPRGIGRSTGVKCFGNEKQAAEVFPPFSFPLTPEEEAIQQAGDRLLADQCDKRGNKVGEHMSTANVARDMERLREALGEEQLNYVGLSYGSYLGVTYANLFPERVRAVVIDGVLDPEGWANIDADVPFSTRLRADEGAQETLEKFFQLCDAARPGNCALAPNSAGRFAALADALLTASAVLVDPIAGAETAFTYQDLIEITLTSLYNPFGYADLAGLLAALEAFTDTSTFFAALVSLEQSTGLVNKRGFPNYVNFAEGLPSVACSDSNNPTDYRIWSHEGAAADALFGYFGRIWTWLSSPCAQWPLEDAGRYQGPFNARSANPVLVFGNLYDPATRYDGAQRAGALLPNSGLLTVDVPGHTSLGLSGCAALITGRYLLDPAVAGLVDGFTCPMAFNPFDLVADATAEVSGVHADLRTRLMSEIAFSPFR